MTTGRATTKTGGRKATVRHIPPVLALSVGMPATRAPDGWQWSALAKIAKLESGHTPSRKHPEYWGGEIPWISIKDARDHHAGTVADTREKTNPLGIENSSARVLPTGTVCLSRTASVGYSVVMGAPMATSQDFVNWICSPELSPRFLQYLFIAEGKDILRFASGSVHQTIYFPEVKAFHICHPPLPEQERIVGILDEAFEGIVAATAHAERNLANARELFQSVLQSTFEQKGEDWVETTLLDAVEEDCSLSYGIVQPGDDQPGGLPIVRPTDMVSRVINWDGLKLIDPEKADSYQRTKLRGGEILLCVRGTTGNLAVAAAELAGANVTRGIVPVRFDAEIVNHHFGFYLLLSPTVQQQIKAATYGTALMQINIRDVKKLRLRFPPLQTQKSIVQTLDALSAETRRLEAIYQRKLDALAELKQSLLQRAFSGGL